MQSPGDISAASWLWISTPVDFPTLAEIAGDHEGNIDTNGTPSMGTGWSRMT